jgi:hypothetical protein
MIKIMTEWLCVFVQIRFYGSIVASVDKFTGGVV